MKIRDIQDDEVLYECLEPIDEIYSDTDIFNQNVLNEKTKLIAVTKLVWAKHKDACKKLFEILELKPTGALDNIMFTNTILWEIESDPELLAFFMGFISSVKSFYSATANIKDDDTENQQSETTLDT